MARRQSASASATTGHGRETLFQIANSATNLENFARSANGDYSIVKIRIDPAQHRLSVPYQAMLQQRFRHEQSKCLNAEKTE